MGAAVVQAACAANSSNGNSQPSATFGTTPTSGNTLVALIWMSQAPAGGGPVQNTGWTLEQSSGPGSGFASWWGLYSRVAGASEPTTQTPESNTRSYWGANLWEVSGLTGTWATDFVAWHNNPTNNLGSATLTTASFNTANNNELVLLAAAGYSNVSVSISSNNGTSDASATSSGGTDAFGTFDDCHAYHFVEPTSGTAIQSTLTQTVNNNTAIAYAYVEFNSPTSVAASGNIGTITLDAPTGGATASATASGTIGTITLDAPAGAGVTGAQIQSPKMLAQAVIGLQNVIESPKMLAQAVTGIDGVLQSPKMLAQAATGVTDAAHGVTGNSIASPKMVAYAVLGPPPPRRPAQVRATWSR